VLFFYRLIPTKNRFPKVGTLFPKERMEQKGNECTVIIYPDGKRGWFNYGNGDGAPFHETMAEALKFLETLGYLKAD
jgi:hypothetical protein